MKPIDKPNGISSTQTQYSTIELFMVSWTLFIFVSCYFLFININMESALTGIIKFILKKECALLIDFNLKIK
jgi:hypothetical protein